ncbi:MAG: SDR family oxidoreductase [Proteobacteria bacterium]|nr:SDR family oxidoreductase [Pseudomonadota bacterium]
MQKTILITGCSTGIGYELVKILLKQGHLVMATMRNAEARKAVFSEELKVFPQTLEVLELDVCNHQDIESLKNHIEQKHEGKLDVLVNNAGYGVFGAFEDVSEKQMLEQFNVNVFGLFHCTKQFLPALRKAKGKIFNVSSILGVMSLPLSSMYCASKHAVEGFSESLYFELKPFGVQFCSVEPGGHSTKFRHNMVFGENCFNENSPYIEKTKVYQQFLDKKIKNPRVPAGNVSELIAKLIMKDKIPLRVLCGIDAKFAYYTKKILPLAVYKFILKIALRVMYY